MNGADGTPLAVDVTPGIDDGTVVFAHATGFCKEVWGPVQALMAGRRTMVRFDARAHGDSGDPGPPYDWWDLGRDVLAITADVGTPILGVGHSAGAAAMVLAELLEPGLFEHLILVEPIIFPGPPIRVEGHPLTEGALRRRPSFASLDEARANFAGKAAFARWTQDSLDAYVRGGLRRAGDVWELKCSPDSEADFYRGAVATGAWDRLVDLTVGVTLVAGEHSDTHTPAFMESMAGQIPSAVVEIVPATTHFVPMEDPGAIARIVDGHESGRPGGPAI
ncbi:MAG: alpha/beta hydrolase [Acidimicrobiia bacterium]|nr:alpha/beta hydrolase [Acidimicrobiia bacterium]